MIVTVTANPAVDRLVPLASALLRGEVQTTADAVDEAGGKGVNVARVLHAAGTSTTAVVAGASDSFVSLLGDLPVVPVLAARPVRVNLTLAEPDGTTTKLNTAGPVLTPSDVSALEHAVLAAAEGADWVALCGSLPPGVDDAWYARLVGPLRERGAAVAVDTSGAALHAVLADPVCGPDVVKPNGAELVEALGDAAGRVSAAEVEADPTLAATLAQRLRAERGPAAVLLTLGATGAVLATADGSWFCPSPPVAARSTVGAGDASLAGYLIARADGSDDAAALASAVAHGSAAASLAGTTPPTPSDVAALASVSAVPLPTPQTSPHPTTTTAKDPSWTA